MKRQKLLLIPILACLVVVPAEAQQRSPNPQGPQGAAGANNSPALLDLLNLLQAQQNGTLSARGGGGRGPIDDGVTNQLRELERFINRAGAPVVVTVASGAWWANAMLANRLGLTDDQKAKILTAFENHRLTLESNKAALEKEEAQLSRLLDAETIDRNAALTQIFRVASARAEMERTNATMTLEMREHLTRAQWTQLQAQSNATMRISPTGGARGGSTPFGAVRQE